MANKTFRTRLADLGAAQKPGRGAPPYSRWINRRLGRYLAAAADVIGLTPDQVTIISAFFTYSALVLVIVVPPLWWLGLVVALMLVIGYALDAADGQLARLRGGGSRAGEWLDHIVDAGKIGVMHSAVLISFYRFSGERSLVLVVPLIFMVSSFVFFFGMILTDQIRRASAAAVGLSYSKPSHPGGGFQTLVAIPTDYGLVCLTFVLLPAHSVFVIVYALLALAQFVITGGVLVRWWRELRKMDSRA
ncbi:MAG TPA: CDP-alcohol phosphatidyltransferase family protein [Pseudolysinimonas sp.]|nr:CDP-alcohol phosphatidyltransferase family protein [Pseudolysinimonas sp.]